jgi:hypothetical protein
MKTVSQLVATGVRRSDLKIRDAHHPRDHTRIGHQKERAAEKLRLRNRWFMLAVLFVVRLITGFQFQSVAAVAPLLGRDFGVGLADIEIMIGLYFTPASRWPCRAPPSAKGWRREDGTRRPAADADRRPCGIASNWPAYGSADVSIAATLKTTSCVICPASWKTLLTPH